MPRLRESHSYATIFPAQTRRKEDKPMKKGIIFDLDGTLINSLPDISAAMNRALAKAGLPAHPEEAYKYLVGDGVIKLSERAVGARLELAPQVLADYMPDYARNCRVNTHPYAGVPEALAGLAARGLKICVLTNKDQSDAEHILAYYFPAVHFSAVRGRVPGVALKPHPQGALLIAKALEIAPEDFWYVGDTRMDMLCGNAAGMETIGVLWGFRPRAELTESGAKHLAKNAAELLQIVDG